MVECAELFSLRRRFLHRPRGHGGSEGSGRRGGGHGASPPTVVPSFYRVSWRPDFCKVLLCECAGGGGWRCRGWNGGGPSLGRLFDNWPPLSHPRPPPPPHPPRPATTGQLLCMPGSTLSFHPSTPPALPADSSHRSLGGPLVLLLLRRVCVCVRVLETRKINREQPVGRSFPVGAVVFQCDDVVARC